MVRRPVIARGLKKASHPPTPPPPLPNYFKMHQQALLSLLREIYFSTPSEVGRTTTARRRSVGETEEERELLLCLVMLQVFLEFLAQGSTAAQPQRQRNSIDKRVRTLMRPPAPELRGTLSSSGQLTPFRRHKSPAEPRAKRNTTYCVLAE